MGGAIWSEARVARLMDLRGRGFSASEIASAFGDVSRGAVLGKLSRLEREGRRASPQVAAFGGDARPAPYAAAETSWRAEAPLEAASDDDEARRDGDPACEGDDQGWPQERASAWAWLRDIRPEERCDPTPPRPGDAALRTLESLAAGECRWPVGDPLDEKFGFCGRKRRAGSSYCARHHARAFAPPKRRGTAERRRERPRSDRAAD